MSSGGKVHVGFSVVKQIAVLFVNFAGPALLRVCVCWGGEESH